jgi:hypothetical protein
MKGRSEKCVGADQFAIQPELLARYFVEAGQYEVNGDTDENRVNECSDERVRNFSKYVNHFGFL